MTRGVDDQSGIRPDPPPKLETGFTTLPPKPAAVVRRRVRWVRLAIIALAIAAAVGLVTAGATGLLQHILFGFPVTPMTVRQANQIVGAAPPLGSTLEEVEAWLLSQGIRPLTKGTMTGYYVCRRGDPPGPGSDPGRVLQIGDKTVAELAGLKTDAVYCAVVIPYPDADRSFISTTRLSIFFFFDSQDRLIGHYVDEDVLMP